LDDRRRGLLAGAGFGRDLHVDASRKDLLEAHPHDIVVIDDQQANHGVGS